MAGQPQRHRSPRTKDAPNTSPKHRSPRLKVAETPTKPKAVKQKSANRNVRRSLGGVTTLALFGLFAVCLALAALHAVLVENQASLDELLLQNELHTERLHQLQAEVAHLDSPEGLAVQAQAAGLVPAAELVVLNPTAHGQVPPPNFDPFGLVVSGIFGDPAQTPVAALSAR